jgi:hypothetical protein
MTKSWAFFVHFNRVNMQRGDPRVWTIHFRGTCYQVEDFSTFVPMHSSYRPDGQQPRATMRGKASEVTVSDGVGVIR